VAKIGSRFLVSHDARERKCRRDATFQSFRACASAIVGYLHCKLRKRRDQRQSSVDEKMAVLQRRLNAQVGG
jgi:hypothetical protein